MKQSVNVLMLLGSQCPHCSTVLVSLSELVKEGMIGKLEVINLDRHPQAAEHYGVRSVPWLRIDQFELTGLRSKTELIRWIEKSGTESGRINYLEELLTEGNIKQVIKLIQGDESLMQTLVGLVDDPDAKINIKLGIGAIIEEYEGSALLQQQVKRLSPLLQHIDARVRADVCHYFSLSHATQARDLITPLLDDCDETVREVAQESLDYLEAG